MSAAANVEGMGSVLRMVTRRPGMWFGLFALVIAGPPAALGADPAPLPDVLQRRDWLAALQAAQQTDRPVLLLIWDEEPARHLRRLAQAVPADLLAELEQLSAPVHTTWRRRPDLGEFYSHAAVALGLADGLLSHGFACLLTPTGEPYHAALVPPYDANELPALVQTLITQAERWRTDRLEVEQQATAVMAAVAAQQIEPVPPANLTREVVTAAEQAHPSSFMGHAGGGGTLGHHVRLATQLLDLFDATGDTRWRETARALAETIIDRFGAPDGGFYLSANDDGPPVRLKLAGITTLYLNAAAAALFLRLAKLDTLASDYERAFNTVAAFWNTIHDDTIQANPLPRLARRILNAQRPSPPVPDPPTAAPEPQRFLDSRQHNAVSARLAEPIQPGGQAMLEVTLDIADGWHINPSVAEGFLIPTQVSVNAPDGFTVGEVVYPPAQTIIEPDGKLVEALAGQTIIRVPLILPATVPPDAEAVISVRFQACSADACLPPAQVRVVVPLVTADTDGR